MLINYFTPCPVGLCFRGKHGILLEGAHGAFFQIVSGAKYCAENPLKIHNGDWPWTPCIPL